MQARSLSEFQIEGVAKNRFTILSGQTNLYDLFETATHHVTAFSSCCYEATLLVCPRFCLGLQLHGIINTKLMKASFHGHQEIAVTFRPG